MKNVKLIIKKKQVISDSCQPIIAYCSVSQLNITNHYQAADIEKWTKLWMWNGSYRWLLSLSTACSAVVNGVIMETG